MTNSRNQGILLEVGTNEFEVLLFRLGKQAYGINVAKVCQIVIFDESKVAPLPHQVSGVLGVIDFRGNTTSVIDLKAFLALAAPDLKSDRKLLLIVEFNRKKNAFVVDGVDRIERCSWQQFDAMNETGGSLAATSVVGTLTLKDEIVVLLDVERIMGTIDPTMSVEHFEKDIPESKTIDRGSVSIMSCEDSTVVQKILIRTLETAGYKKIKTFTTGAEGLEYLKSADRNELDIIISDIEMPQLDGLTFCKNTRAIPSYKEIPFVFFSSMINEQMARKCKAVGGDGCFSKPEIHELVSAVDRIVAEYRAK